LTAAPQHERQELPRFARRFFAISLDLWYNYANPYGGGGTVDGKQTRVMKLTRNLAGRIMTIILITVIPLCMVMISIAIVTLFSSFRHMQEQARQQMEANLNRLEADILRIEDYAEEFVNEYMIELNAGDGLSSQLVPYDMMEDLQRLFSHTGLQGAVYLVSGDGTWSMARSGGGLYTPRELDALQDWVLENESAGFESLTLAGHELMRREYVYTNVRAGFIVDLPAGLRSVTPGSFTDETIIYVQNGQSVFRYFADGTVQPEADGPDMPEQTEANIVWQGSRIPLTVSVRYPWTTLLESVPAVNWLLLLVAALCLLLMPLIWYVLKKDVLVPVARLTGALQELRHGNESFRLNEHDHRYADEMLYLFESFDEAADEMQRSKEKDVKMVKAELDNLRLQVNPHMLLNSYNMIFALAQSKKFDTIQEYSLHLVNYFRYVLRKTDELVPVRQEMAFILNFIDIQRIRFPNSFRFTYRVGKDCDAALIPPLLIENFVENSLKYALIPGEMVEVMVDIQHIERQLHIAVSDTGNGIKPEVLEALNKGEPYVDPAGNKHIGIWNCMRRVEVFYGEKARLEITSQRDNGTSIILMIPYREEKSDETADRR